MCLKTNETSKFCHIEIGVALCLSARKSADSTTSRSKVIQILCVERFVGSLCIDGYCMYVKAVCLFSNSTTVIS